MEALAIAFIDQFSDQYVWDEDMVLTKRDTSATEWASEKMIDLALENPEELWDPILEILKRDPPTEVIEVLAAGPLEDYIAKLGERVIDRVEVQAAADAKFRNARRRLAQQYVGCGLGESSGMLGSLRVGRERITSQCTRRAKTRARDRRRSITDTPVAAP